MNLNLSIINPEIVGYMKGMQIQPEQVICHLLYKSSRSVPCNISSIKHLLNGMIGCSSGTGIPRWRWKEKTHWYKPGKHCYVLQVCRKWIQGCWWHRLYCTQSVRCHGCSFFIVFIFLLKFCSIRWMLYLEFVFFLGEFDSVHFVEVLATVEMLGLCKLPSDKHD